MAKLRSDRLLQLATHLETKVPKSRFDLSRWGSGEHGCGFAGCAMGWAAHDGLFGLSYNRFSSGSSVRHKASGRSGFGAACEVFGISHVDARVLFHSLSYGSAHAAQTYAPTTCEVAAKIRRFVTERITYNSGAMP